MEPNYRKMATDELRKYIFNHRDDEDAVHEMVQRILAEGKDSTTEEFIEFVKQKQS